MTEDYHIEADVVETICKNVTENVPVTVEFPNKGLLHIDKLLPYICVYRYKKRDVYFSRLLKTQASYLIVDEDIDISHLLEAIRLITSERFDTFLILELWPNNDSLKHQFQIYGPKTKSLETLNALREGFSEIRKTLSYVDSKIIHTEFRHPKHLTPLLGVEQSKKQGTLIIGVSIPTVYENTATNQLFSLFFRKFYTIFSETIKRAVHEFIRVQTTDAFENYLMLGKTHIDAITLSADSKLAEISEGMSFLLRVTPVNSNEEWDKFEQNNFEKPPSFKYRLLAVDPELEKRKLFNIPIDLIEDPTIAFILRGKRLEIEKQLIMLEERGTENFRFIGESLYGVIREDILQVAKHILQVYPEGETIRSSKRYNGVEFAEFAQREMDYYTQLFPEVDLGIEIRDDVAGIMVSKSKLLINEEMNLDVNRCDALIQHEIGTHILTYCNGKSQPLKQMHEGFEGYDQLQEGLAVIAEYLVGGLTINRLRLLAGRVIAVQSMVDNASFIETFNLLRSSYAFPARVAYYISMRVYRGGGLTKDAVYLAGLIDLMAYLKNGGKLEPLYTGKFNVTHIKLIEELLYREVLKQPVLPRFLKRDDVKIRLQKLREGINIVELVN
ncbi:tyrosine/phenylalanine carboxypeptidase domain-containing protein [uncultured Gelidibacter sp.]|uniref:flavohemoglobin expression-modulating QEGLA motif protein n=1 Tax=uncultured Gelidibacter sp. TaxID=259318 RepID=UPI0026354B55|nr:tyrosine/phenylalanine carboxypeptidase domain-containing protein [uncultured Gelidibacter sp.]